LITPMKVKSAIGYATLLVALSMPGLAQAGFSPFNWMDDARDNFDSNSGDSAYYGSGRRGNEQYGTDRYSNDRYRRNDGNRDAYGSPDSDGSPDGYAGREGWGSPYSGRNSNDRGYGSERWNGYDQWQPNYWRYRYFDRNSPDYLPDQFGGDQFPGDFNRNRDSSREQRQYRRPYSNQNRYSGQRRGYRSDFEGSAERDGSGNRQGSDSGGSTSSQNRP